MAVNEDKTDKALGIILIILGIIFFAMGIMIPIIHNSDTNHNTKIGDCFDGHGNKIIGQSCEVIEPPEVLLIFIGGITFIFGISLIMMGVVFYSS